MRHLKLKEVSEMIFVYMKDNNVDLLTSYNQVNLILKEANPHTFEQVKNYLFNNDLSLKYIEKEL